jgi:hypothetical protein
MPIPPDDVYLDALSAAVSALASGETLAADQAAKRLAVELSRFSGDSQSRRQ